MKCKVTNLLWVLTRFVEKIRVFDEVYISDFAGFGNPKLCTSFMSCLQSSFNKQEMVKQD